MLPNNQMKTACPFFLNPQFEKYAAQNQEFLGANHFL
jgi:hypothetical protein